MSESVMSGREGLVKLYPSLQWTVMDQSMGHLKDLRGSFLIECRWPNPALTIKRDRDDLRTQPWIHHH